jgi:hypothetical protein
MRPLPTPAALLAGLAVAACGTADGSEAESEIERSVREDLRAQKVDVDCPDDVKLDGGARFECRATVDGRRGVLLVSRRTGEGPVRWRLKPASAKPQTP